MSDGGGGDDDNVGCASSIRPRPTHTIDTNNEIDNEATLEAPAHGPQRPGPGRPRLTAPALEALSAEVLAIAVSATEGNETAAVSAMLTATETAVLNLTLDDRDFSTRSAAAGPSTAKAATGETDTAPGSRDEGKGEGADKQAQMRSILAAVFGARRDMGLEPQCQEGDVIFGTKEDGPGSEQDTRVVQGNEDFIDSSPSTWPESEEVLRDVGYSKDGWESLGGTTTEDWMSGSERTEGWRSGVDGAEGSSYGGGAGHGGGFGNGDDADRVSQLAQSASVAAAPTPSFSFPVPDSAEAGRPARMHARADASGAPLSSTIRPSTTPLADSEGLRAGAAEGGSTRHVVTFATEVTGHGLTLDETQATEGVLLAESEAEPGEYHEGMEEDEEEEDPFPGGGTQAWAPADEEEEDDFEADDAEEDDAFDWVGGTQAIPPPEDDEGEEEELAPDTIPPSTPESSTSDMDLVTQDAGAGRPREAADTTSRGPLTAVTPPPAFEGNPERTEPSAATAPGSARRQSLDFYVGGTQMCPSPQSAYPSIGPVRVSPAELPTERARTASSVVAAMTATAAAGQRAAASPPAAGRPPFLRLSVKPAATLPRRLSMPPLASPAIQSPATAGGGVAAETPRSLWTAAGSAPGFKTPSRGAAPVRDGTEDGASGMEGKAVVHLGTSPFPSSLRTPGASAAVPEAFEQGEGGGDDRHALDAPQVMPHSLSPLATAPPVATLPLASGDVIPATCDVEPSMAMEEQPAEEQPRGGTNTFAGARLSQPPIGTPVDVMCSFIPSTFPPQTAAAAAPPSLPLSSVDCSPPMSVAAAAAAAAAAVDPVYGAPAPPLSFIGNARGEVEADDVDEVPMSVAVSPKGKPTGVTGHGTGHFHRAAAAAMNARHRRQVNFAQTDIMSLSLGPPDGMSEKEAWFDDEDKGGSLEEGAAGGEGTHAAPEGRTQQHSRSNVTSPLENTSVKATAVHGATDKLTAADLETHDSGTETQGNPGVFTPFTLSHPSGAGEASQGGGSQWSGARDAKPPSQAPAPADVVRSQGDGAGWAGGWGNTLDTNGLRGGVCHLAQTPQATAAPASGPSASPDFCLMKSQQVRDVVAEAAGLPAAAATTPWYTTRKDDDPCVTNAATAAADAETCNPADDEGSDMVDSAALGSVPSSSLVQNAEMAAPLAEDPPSQYNFTDPFSFDAADNNQLPSQPSPPPMMPPPPPRQPQAPNSVAAAGAARGRGRGQGRGRGRGRGQGGGRGRGSGGGGGSAPPSTAVVPRVTRRVTSAAEAVAAAEAEMNETQVTAYDLEVEARERVRLQRLWDEEEARLSAEESRTRKSGRVRKPRTFFGDSQYPSSQEDKAEAEDQGVSEPDSQSHEEPPESLPLAKRRTPRARKPRKFFGDSQYPSQSQQESEEEEEEGQVEASAQDDSVDGELGSSLSDEEEDANWRTSPSPPPSKREQRQYLQRVDEEDEAADEVVVVADEDGAHDDAAPVERDEESDGDEDPWYVGGTQAFPDASPLPDEDDSEVDAEEVCAPLSAPEEEEKEDFPPPVSKLDTATAPSGGDTPHWVGPLPTLGCPKCRHAPKGCGRCRAILDHAMNGTPLPWLKNGGRGWRGGRGGRGGGRGGRGRGRGRSSVEERSTAGVLAATRPKGRSAPAAVWTAPGRSVSGGRHVQFDDEDDDIVVNDTEDAGAPGGRLSFQPPASAKKRLKTTPNRLFRPASSGKKRGRPPSAPHSVAADSAKRRKRIRRTSDVFAGLTFLLSGIPAKEEADELTDLIETHGGMVQSEVPPPKTPAPFTPSPPVGAPMSQPQAPPALTTRVITPKPGRTLKCLYAAAVGAPMFTPEWIHASLDAGKPLSPASSPRGTILSGSVANDGDDDSGDEGAPATGRGDCGGLFSGFKVVTSGDTRFVREFGLLLRHAGAEVVSVEEVVSTEDQSENEGDEGVCDYVVVQGGTRIPASLQRAAKRLGVSCVWHEWVVESLLANRLGRVKTVFMVK